MTKNDSGRGEWRGGIKVAAGRKLPGAQLVLAPPGELAEALVALVVVVENAVQGGGAQVHQRVVGRLLLLAAGVTVEQVVDLVSYFCGDKIIKL